MVSPSRRQARHEDDGGSNIEMPHSFRRGGKAAVGTGTLPVWVQGRSIPARRRHGLSLTKQLNCRTSPAVSGSGGVGREANSPARAEGGASPIPGND